MTRPISLKRLAAFLLLTLLSTAGQSADPKAAERAAYLESIKKAEALYKERCATVAGERIYRKVEGVEGVLLMKVRPAWSDRNLADPNWPGAAFALEATGNEYIETFLGYEHPLKSSVGLRGDVSTDRGGKDSIPGYRYVDVIDETDGKRYRYTGSMKIVGKKDVRAANVRARLERDPNYDINVYRWTLDKTLTSAPPPRYGVTFEDHVIPEERALWVASSTIRVIDLQTNEVMGEMTRYAMSYVHIASSSNPAPWLSARKFPAQAAGSHAATRKFVDQILIPPKENQQ